MTQLCTMAGRTDREMTQLKTEMKGKSPERAPLFIVGDWVRVLLSQAHQLLEPLCWKTLSQLWKSGLVRTVGLQQWMLPVGWHSLDVWGEFPLWPPSMLHNPHPPPRAFTVLVCLQLMSPWSDSPAAPCQPTPTLADQVVWQILFLYLKNG